MLAYESQESEQTLAEGIAEYYAANPGLADVRDMSTPGQEFFRCHDAAHVIFGCSTDLDDEAVVKIASVFGTTAGLHVLAGYRLHESVQIYRRLRLRAILITLSRSAILVPRTIARCLRQRARWPWSGFERFLGVPLYAIRAEFGIRVARGHRPAGQVL